MRLIDADELKELFAETITYIAEKTDKVGALEHMIRASATVIEMIDDAPAADAIPIEFIQKEIEKWDSYGSGKKANHAMGLRHLIEDWRWTERKEE